MSSFSSVKIGANTVFLIKHNLTRIHDVLLIREIMINILRMPIYFQSLPPHLLLAILFMLCHNGLPAMSIASQAITEVRIADISLSKTVFADFHTYGM